MDQAANQTQFGALFRRFGFPSIMQLSFQRTRFDRCACNGVKSQDMKLHTVPWPVDLLTELGMTQVQLRVTLSFSADLGIRL
jgi:hypothetical protein